MILDLFTAATWKPSSELSELSSFSSFILQWRLPAPPSVRPFPQPSAARSCLLLARTENALFASTRRWTPSSTPAATCVCATTAGLSWRDRSMHAAPSAGGPSKMSSRHTGHNDPGVQTGATTTTTAGCHPCLTLRFGLTLLNWRSAIPKHNCAY